MSLWVIGGLDPTGGAGVSRDRATAAAVAPGLEVVAVITAMTQQGDGQPARARAIEAARLRAALSGLGSASAIKLGLVPAVRVDVVVAALAGIVVPRVLDPVLRASDGGDLGADVAGTCRLAAHVDLVTPNRDEAVALLGELPDSREGLVTAVARFSVASMLVKDADRSEPDWVCDRLVHDGACHEFRRRRVQGPDPRGTGCALATVIACAMARGDGLVAACGAAIAWLDDARRRTVIGPDGRHHLAP